MLFDLWRHSVASVRRHRKHVAGRTAVFLVRTSMVFQCPADIPLHPPAKLPRLRFPTRTATSVSPEHSRLFASFCFEKEGLGIRGVTDRGLNGIQLWQFVVVGIVLVTNARKLAAHVAFFEVHFAY